MAFPLTHLLVADAIITRHPRKDADAALFYLGALAPDAVHYRQGLTSASQREIGKTKKISHLCPQSSERWGEVTDNAGWIDSVKYFIHNNPGPLAEGYAVHAMTDIYTNMTIWENFRTQHPEEAAKGYKSNYYRDLREIEIRLYQLQVQASRIERLLPMADPVDMPGLVTAAEMNAIKENILYKHCKNQQPTPGYQYTFVSYDETISFIQQTANFIEAVLI